MSEIFVGAHFDANVVPSDSTECQLCSLGA